MRVCHVGWPKVLRGAERGQPCGECRISGRERCGRNCFYTIAGRCGKVRKNRLQRRRIFSIFESHRGCAGQIMVKRGVKIGRHFHLKAAREARRSSEVILGAAELACLAWDGLGFVVVSLPLSSHTHTTDKVRRRTTNMVDNSARPQQLSRPPREVRGCPR